MRGVIGCTVIACANPSCSCDPRVAVFRRKIKRRRRRRNYDAIALIGCLLLVACAGCADSWLLYPSTDPMSKAHWDDRRIISCNGRRVEVFIARSPGVTPTTQPQAYSLEFVGNSARAEVVASQSALIWGSRPVEVWAMNYPGFGKSDGPASLGLIPEAALAAYDQLKIAAAGRPIILKGFSMGTTAALCIAARRPCAGMILQSPPPLQREIMQKWGWWNLWMVASVTALEVPGELNSLNNAPKVTVPALFILSGNDTIVPLEYQLMVVDRYAGSKLCRIREGAAHNQAILPGDRTLQRDLDWFWSTTVNP